MRRLHKPDPVPMRQAEYQKMDPELLHALVETVEALAEQGITLPQSMTDVLERRKAVKARFKKP